MRIINSREPKYYAEGNFKQTYEVNYDYSYQQNFESNKNKTIENISSITYHSLISHQNTLLAKQQETQTYQKKLQTRRGNRQTSSRKCITRSTCPDREPSRLGTVEETYELNIRGTKGFTSCSSVFQDFSFFYSLIIMLTPYQNVYK